MEDQHNSHIDELARANEELRQTNIELIQEIEHRQQAEELNREQDALLQSIFRSAPVGIGLVVDRVFTWTNDRLSELTGYSKAELLGQSSRLLYASDDDFSWVGKEKYRQIKHSGSGTVETRWQKKDGGIIDILLSSTPINPDDLSKGVTFTAMDITKQCLAKQALAENEQRLELALSATDLGTWDWNLTDNSVFFDERYFAMLGYGPHELPQTMATWETLLHPDDRTQAKKQVMESLATGKNHWSLAFRLRAKDGHYAWTLGRGKVVEFDKHGIPLRAIGTHLDISTTKEAELALTTSEERFRELFNNMGTGVAIYQVIDDGHDFLIKEFNRAALRSSRLTASQVVGKRLSQVFPGVKEMGLFAVLQRVWQHGLPETFPSSHYQDERLNIWTENYVCKLPSGEIVAIYEDITDRKQAEIALRQSHAQWEKTFNAIPDIITLQDNEMHIVQANKAAYTFWGDQDSSLLGQKCHHVFSTSETACPDCPALVSLEDLCNHSADIEHVGLKKTFHVTSSPVLDENNQVEFLVHIAKDITEHKKLEKELFQAYKMEAIGTLAGGIAHDFNNILSAIIGFAELAKLNLPPGDQSSQDINQILKASERATGLVQQILAFSRKSDISLHPITPHLIIKEALKMLRASLPTSIAIEEDIDSNCGHILADPTQLHQIMINLCTNALHAMAEEKGILRVTLKRQNITAAQRAPKHDTPTGPYIVLSVSDSGCGMDKATLEHIFDPYFTTKESGRGTGLGLAVLHGIVQDYHGFIQVTSSPGKGSTFQIYFPAINEKNQAEENIPRAPAARGSEHILAVDDDEALTMLYKASLEHLGYQVTATTDSREALRLLQAKTVPFDLLLTDQTMPNLTGAELARAALDLHPELPIILCTGYSSVISEEEATAMGIHRYLRKPIMNTELAAHIRSILDHDESE